VRLPKYVVTFALHDPAVFLQVLPLDYDPDIIADYWGRRPVAVATRVVQLLGIAGGFLGGLALDFVQNRTQQNQV
jgi:aarF domain-containing kinase